MGVPLSHTGHQPKTLSLLNQSAPTSLMLQGSLSFSITIMTIIMAIIIKVFIALVILAIKPTPCRFLEETNCAGMCTNLCKIPSQTFITHSLGMPVDMVPSKYSHSATICMAGHIGIRIKSLYVAQS